MRFEWDPAKEAANQTKHGVSFGDATALFTSDADYLELPDVEHDNEEDRMIAIGAIERGVIMVVFTQLVEDTIRIISARKATKAETQLQVSRIPGRLVMIERELTAADFKRVIRHSVRARLMAGAFQGGQDIVALRHFTGLTQESFAEALGISVHTLRNWEQDRRRPEGPALALLRIAARHPRVLKENLAAAG